MGVGCDFSAWLEKLNCWNCRTINLKLSYFFIFPIAIMSLYYKLSTVGLWCIQVFNVVTFGVLITEMVSKYKSVLNYFIWSPGFSVLSKMLLYATNSKRPKYPWSETAPFHWLHIYLTTLVMNLCPCFHLMCIECFALQFHPSFFCLVQGPTWHTRRTILCIFTSILKPSCYSNLGDWCSYYPLRLLSCMPLSSELSATKAGSLEFWEPACCWCISRGSFPYSSKCEIRLCVYFTSDTYRWCPVIALL